MRDPALDLARVRGMSLEKKLPLLMTSVLLAILGAGVFFAYRETRRASELVTAARLRDVADGLAHATGTSIPRLALQFREVTRDPAVRNALAARRASPADMVEIGEALRTLSAASDSGVTTELWMSDGTVLARIGDPRAEVQPMSAIVTGPDSLAVSAFYESGGRVFYWVTRTVADASGRLGTIAQRRRLNAQAATQREIERLTGQKVEVLFRNADNSLWTTLGGRRIGPPSDSGRLRGMQTYMHEHVTPAERVLWYEKAVDRTPWVVVLELPVSSLGAGPREMLEKFALVSVALLLVGALALWLISRRITSPLARLTAAAEAIAKGDYSQRVDPRGDYEIARLGVSFNRMAAEIASANTALRQTARSAATAREAAEAANAAKTNFLAAMSHELRTPLNAIAGYVDILELELRGPLTSEQKTDLARVKRSQQYLLGLIEEILVFSQLDAQQLAFDIADVAIDAVIRDADSMVTPQMQAKGISYVYEGCGDGMVVRADRDKTQQILINLLVNATKYSEPGGTVTVSCAVRDSMVLISVADTGVGIPDVKLSHIFDAFVQLDRRLNQPREGVGLGLTISRDLARAMGGDLTVESTEGIGSRFTIELPLAASPGAGIFEIASSRETATA